MEKKAGTVETAVAKTSSKVGNYIYSIKVPFVSGAAGRFLGATNMPANAGIGSYTGAYARRIWVNGVYGTIKGVAQVAAHPIQTGQGVGKIVKNPGLVANAVGQYIGKR